MLVLSLLLFVGLRVIAVKAIEDPLVDVSTPLRETIRNKHTDVQITVQLLEFTQDYMETKIRGFEKLTGAIVNTAFLSSQESWFDDIDEDVAGAGFIDLYAIFGNWIPTFVEKDAFLDITEDINDQAGLDWFDIMPAVRSGVASYQEKIYAVPLDGDVIIMLYRTDLVEGVGLPTPNTWDDVLKITEYYANKDFTGDGVPDFANCFSTKSNDIAGTMFWSIASSFLQRQGTSQGAFFDPDTFEPISSDEEFLKVLEVYNKLVQESPFRDKGPTNWQDNLAEFEQGRCVLWFNYPGPTRVLVSNQEQNNMTGVLNYAPLPGMKCEDTIQCPFMSEDGANHAPFLASGGMSYAVNARAPSDQQQAALDFAFYISDPAVGYWDVAYPGSYLDPLRRRHTAALSNPESPEAVTFLEFGWEVRQLQMLKDVTEFNFLSDNYVKDLRILGANQYQEAGTVPHLLKMWSGEKTAQETAQAITQSWNSVTETYGLKEQRDFYRDILGLAPYVEEDSDDDFPFKIVIPILAVAALLVASLTVLVFKQQHHIRYKTRETANAPKEGTVALLFTDVEGSTMLWDASKSVMSKALDIHHKTIRILIQKHKAYEVKTIGDSFMIATSSADDAVRLANDIQLGLLEADWPVELASMPSACTEFFRGRKLASPNETKCVERAPPKHMFHGLRVRIGVHMGDTAKDEIEVSYDNVTHGYDYYGQATNAAARIEEIGFGGQTIISQDVLDNLSSEVRDKCAMIEIGEVELRGVGGLVNVHQCLPPSLCRRRFEGVFRRRDSIDLSIAASFGIEGMSIGLSDEGSNRNARTTFDRTVDITTLTPVQLQKTVASLRAKLDEAEERIHEMKGENSLDDEPLSD